jgi:hypothetical protein
VRFAARPTGKAGVYHARVVFPTKGTFRYTVDDGFTNALQHTFPPVVIGGPAPAAPPAAAAASGGFPWLGLGVASALLLLAFYARSQRARSFSRSVSKKGASHTGQREASV